MTDPAAGGTRAARPAVIAKHGLMVTSAMLPSGDGNNINGPSVIRTPAWMQHALGRYYMYFAHHNGQYIRLAYANDPLGPWSVHQPGTLQLRECQAVRGHVASPDVHVDDERQRIVLYFHGQPKAGGEQKSYVAESVDGVAFKASEEALGIFYFRVWRHGEYVYALGKARLYRSRDGLSAFEEGPVVYHPENADRAVAGSRSDIRHTCVDLQGNTLVVYYSKLGELQEHIVRGTIDLTSSWKEWRLENEEPILKPTESWEGADLPMTASEAGAANGPVNQLRDPFLFRDSGRVFLYYCAAGEQAIALAELSM